ncbi:alpha-amylase [Allohahella sp. A8]|uniref:alpha-amylase n=1 Tax=Allohahella sp. A8 TaxID=3141461 RepID=UPI003A7FB153
MLSSASNYPLSLLLATLLGILSACASTDISPTRWVSASTDQGNIPLEYTDGGDERRATGTFSAGSVTLDFGGDSQGPAKTAKPFVKVPFETLTGAYTLDLPRDGRYQIRVYEGEEPHFRVTPAPAKVVAAPAPPTDSPIKNDGICLASEAPITVSVGEVFKDGEWVRDFYSGVRAEVVDGEVTMTPAASAEGLLLLEPVDNTTASFTWKGATVYFVVTDRFANGRQDNDNSYGRKPDGEEEIGTFHGGDLAGLTQKLDYLKALGVNAVWITPPFEQIHGWVGGGDRGDFKHYAYHGYYGLDFTRLDENFGTEAELKTLIQEAHNRDIRVLVDVVMNHPGYSTLQDMQTFGYGGLQDGFAQHLPKNWGDWAPQSYENYHAYHALLDYDHPDWSKWWGKDWVRAGIADYDNPPTVRMDERRGSLAFLPDFKTEADKTVDLPVFLQNKADTGARTLENATVRDYLTTWLTDWVRRYGIDGFRVDTVKHVEPEAWQGLKKAGQQALDEYRAANPDQPLPAKDFWMVAEVFPHSVTRSEYFQSGFDAVINFDFQSESARDGARCLSNLEPVFAEYSQKLHGDKPLNVMSYLSSHDTRLFSQMHDDPRLQKRAASTLLLLPGTVQIYYGDESGREFGPTGSDPHQGTRSDMNWAAIEAGEKKELLEHWRKLGQFRDRHPALGAGEHKMLDQQPYTFARTLETPEGADRVVVAFAEAQK